MTLARLGQGEGMVDPYLMEGRKRRISRMSGGSLPLEPHERVNVLLIAHAWDAAHPRDSPRPR